MSFSCAIRAVLQCGKNLQDVHFSPMQIVLSLIKGTVHDLQAKDEEEVIWSKLTIPDRSESQPSSNILASEEDSSHLACTPSHNVIACSLQYLLAVTLKLFEDIWPFARS